MNRGPVAIGDLYAPALRHLRSAIFPNCVSISRYIVVLFFPTDPSSSFFGAGGGGGMKSNSR